MQQDKRSNITLIVPAAGKSSRFPNMRPKWMLTHPDGQLMIEKVLRSFDYENYKETYITILSEHVKDFDADIVISQAFGESVKIVVLEETTSSCPETILRTLEEAKITGRIIIKDTDCLVHPSEILDEDFVVGMSIDENSNVTKIQNKSFIVKNDDNIIQDIVEKSIVSNNICLGVYCLDAENFQIAYREIVSSNMFFKSSEVFVSHIVSHLMLNKGVVFQYVTATEYKDWGTLEEWQKERDSFKTFIFDIDGVMLKNYGKYGKKNWSNTFEPIAENIELVKRLSDAGHEIIFMTSRPEEYVQKFKDYLISEKIKFKTVITGCNHSSRTIINDFASTNPYPSCKSISVMRNGKLENYFSDIIS